MDGASSSLVPGMLYGIVTNSLCFPLPPKQLSVPSASCLHPQPQVGFSACVEQICDVSRPFGSMGMRG